MGTYKDIRTRFEMALNEAKQPGKKAIADFWLDGFKKFLKFNDYVKSPSSRKGSNTGEVLRANFGPNDGTAESKIIEFIEKFGGIKPKTYDIETLPLGVISSDYTAYKIIFKKSAIDKLGKKYKKNDFFVITNRYKISKKTGEVSIIGKKDLTPDKLNITDIEYKSHEHLFAIVSAKIRNLRLPENYTNFILKSTEELINNQTNQNKFNDFEDYTSSKSTMIVFKINEELFDGIDQLSIKNFQNDYGEILGGFLLFNILKDVGAGMTFPKSSNEKLVDFYFDGYSVSSKAGKTGGTPTGDTMIRKIYQLYKNNLIDIENTAEMDFFNNVVKEWINPPKLARSNIYNNIMNLCAVNIQDRNNSAYWYISNKTNLAPNLLNQKDVVAYLDKIYANPIEFKKFIQNTWEKSGMKWDENMLETYIEKYPNMGKNKIGIIFYCLQVEIENTLNKIYSEPLNKFAQMASDIKQIYFIVKINKNMFKFKAVPFKTANFKFKRKGSIPNPFNSNLGIAVVQ